MADYTPPKSSYRPEVNTTHTRENVLDDYDFERVVSASYELKPAHDLETRFALFLCGRLGLRRGELTHLTEDWINWRDQRIEIPEHETCTSGRNGAKCGNCCQMAEQKTEIALSNAAYAATTYNSDIDSASARGVADLERELEKAAERVRLVPDEVREITGPTTDHQQAYGRLMDTYYDDLYAVVLSEQWSPKTENASRSVPYGWNGRSEIVIERYFERWSEWMYCAQAINRRIKWVCSLVDDLEKRSPHDLRGTAATYLAGKGLDTLQLMAYFGWAEASTARTYVASSTEQLDQQLQFLLS